MMNEDAAPGVVIINLAYTFLCVGNSDNFLPVLFHCHFLLEQSLAVQPPRIQQMLLKIDMSTVSPISKGKSTVPFFMCNWLYGLCDGTLPRYLSLFVSYLDDKLKGKGFNLFYQRTNIHLSPYSVS